MRKIAFLLPLALAFSGWSQIPKKTLVGATSATAQALIALENKWVDALQKADTATLNSILADTYVDTDEEGQRSDKQDILAVMKSGDLKVKSIRVSDMEVHAYGGAAVVTGTGVQRGTFKGQPLTLHVVFTDTFIQQNGNWRAVASQRSPATGEPGPSEVSSERYKSTNEVENLLKQIEEDWTTAEINKDTAALDRILADDWSGIDWQGKTETKKQWLATISSPDTKITTGRIVEMKVRQFGNTAVVTGLNEEKSQIRGKETSGRYAWTDVFVNRNGHWQAVASQDNPVPSLEPSESSAEKYIRDSEAQWAEAVANGDVSVVQRILADDYIGVDAGDGHLYDKAEAISFIQEHHNEFISNHLNDVKIRFFGNTAVAQGSESWERRTGEPRQGRFVWTDTWLLRNGHWQVVAAEDLIAPPLPASNVGASNEPHAAPAIPVLKQAKKEYAKLR